MADRIHQLSFNDTMTGLPNRIAFNERLAFEAPQPTKRRTSSPRSRSTSTASRTSTTFRPGAGDLLLIEMAERMRKQLSAGEFLARQSGDEFLALTTSGNHPHDAHAFANRMAQAFAEPFTSRATPLP